MCCLENMITFKKVRKTALNLVQVFVPQRMNILQDIRQQHMAISTRAYRWFTT